MWSVLPADALAQASSPAFDIFGKPKQPKQWQTVPDLVVPSMAHEEAKYVKYGERILLQHAKTGGTMTVRTNLHSESAPNCFTVDLSTGQLNADDNWFRIMPKFKVRQEGEYIRLKDQVGLPMHARFEQSPPEENKTTYFMPSLPISSCPHQHVHCTFANQPRFRVRPKTPRASFLLIARCC